jgi:TolB-like protein/DNA-binding winged helix-turn-helix (wHTH) protein/Flp pilus assembly protein TadD
MLNGTATRPDPQAVFEFADLVLDPRQRAVFRDAVRLPLPKLTYELLLALVDAAPGVLAHDALAARVWGGRLVSPETVAQRVLLLRRALGDAAARPRYVRAVRGVGCQLVPPVRVRRGAFSSGYPAIATTTDGRKVWDAELVGDADLALPSQPSVVILPFEAGDDPEPRDFARGLTHDLITRIGRTRAFFVIARGTAFRFASNTRDVRDVARELGVRYVVQGHVQVSGASVRVNAALADAVEGREVWAEQFHRRLDDAFAMQEDITDLIVGAISSEVEFAERQRALLETPASLDAWSAYHRGCWHMYRFTPGDYERARAFFELSLALDPNSSRTLAGLSFVHWQQAFLEIAPDRPGEVQRALDLARQSVALNPRDPLGHWALGRAHLLRGELDEALVELGTSTDLNPSFAVGQYTLGFALMQAGELSRSVERADKARRLSPYDPLGFAMIGVRGFSLALDGHFEEAARLMRLAVREPNAHYHMVAMAAVCDALAGRDDAARRDLARLRAVRPGYGVGDFLRAFQFQRPADTQLIGSAFRRLARLR